jgi:hypothetical protein
MGLFYLLEIDSFLVQSDLNVIEIYFVGFFVLFDELFEVGAGIAQFLFADVEDDLNVYYK